ncbi:AVAST type 1 anti-phage system protein Avs1c [Neorhodopirellula lusitana]|uniref:AVAST type 1 anti-phage system protein Avs1c n=1 Tax=Neorhodopirellula lusitana TaxID=445327 RepID=UPI00384DCA91
MFSEMKTPKTRKEFERAFHFLSEQMRDGKFRFSAHMVDGMNSLRSVRNLPNGRIDFLSVNELARLNANSTLNFMETRRAEMEELFEETEESDEQIKSEEKL